MSRHFCFLGQQPEAKRLPGRSLSAPWLRPSAAPGLAEAPELGACAPSGWPSVTSASSCVVKRETSYLY
eukprot:7305400-Prymnesium_polylepis.1